MTNKQSNVKDTRSSRSLNQLTLKKVRELLDKKEVTSEEVIRDCMNAIEKLDPAIHAYLTVNTSNTSDTYSHKNKKGFDTSIAGIPIAIKDNFLTKGLRTTASSRVLDDFIPTYSATVVSKIERAGGFILGKTNMDAWAHGSSTETSDYGPSRNPWDVNRVPGGSSGGSSAAVAADMCIAAIGSETAGSVRGPAAWCGCVGLKPTYGRVSRYGVVAMGSSLDCPGPLTKSVEDAAILLQILAGNDPNDATTSKKLPDDYVGELGKDILGFKIGIAEDYLLPNMSSDVKKLILDAAKVLENLGAQIEYIKTLDPRYAIPDYTIIQRSEVSSNLARYDGIRYGGGREFFGQEAKRRIILGTFALSAGYADKFYKKAQKVRTLYIDDFNKVFQKVDLILGPTMPGGAPKIGVTKGAAMFGEMADVLVEPSSMAGLPGISVPCGFSQGLPIGLDLIGPQFSEKHILRAAYQYEQATSWHKERPKLPS